MIGLSQVYAQYTNDQTFFAAEKAARTAPKGLWTDPNPIRPSDWRHGGQKLTANPVQVAATANTSSFGGQQSTKQYCPQMTSCDEAKRALAVGMKHLAGDGKPCHAMPCHAMRKVMPLSSSAEQLPNPH